MEYVPTAWVVRSSYEPILSSANNWQYDILFNQGGWMTAGLLPDPRKKLWTENQRRNKQGPFWEQSVSGTTPKMKPAVSQQFQWMANYFFLLRLSDHNGQKWILGTIDEPFEFSANATAGNNGSLNKYDISFRSTTSKRAHGFVPVL